MIATWRARNSTIAGFGTTTPAERCVREALTRALPRSIARPGRTVSAIVQGQSTPRHPVLAASFIDVVGTRQDRAQLSRSPSTLVSLRAALRLPVRSASNPERIRQASNKTTQSSRTDARCRHMVQTRGNNVHGVVVRVHTWQRATATSRQPALDRMSDGRSARRSPIGFSGPPFTRKRLRTSCRTSRSASCGCPGKASTRAAQRPPITTERALVMSRLGGETHPRPSPVWVDLFGRCGVRDASWGVAVAVRCRVGLARGGSRLACRS